MALDGGQQDNGGLFLPNGTQYMTQQLVTIPVAEPAAQEAVPVVPAATEAATPAAPSQDPHLELAKKFESVAQKEGRVQKANREAQAKLASIAEREAKIAAREAELDEALGDPVGHMLKSGVDPVKVAERYAKPESPEEKRIRKLEEYIETKAAEDKSRQERIEQDREAQAKFETLKGFVGAITAEECPNLTALYEAREVPSLVEELLNRPVASGESMLESFRDQHGRNPSNAEIRECLEYEAEVRATKIIEADRLRREASIAKPPGGPEQHSSKNESGPNGISNQHAASTTTASKKPLSLEERRRKARKDLTAALETEAGDD